MRKQQVRQLAITTRFKVEDLREALKEMVKAAGVKGQPLVFLVTDSQVAQSPQALHCHLRSHTHTLFSTRTTIPPTHRPLLSPT